MAHAGSGQVKGRVKTMALWIAGRALGELTASLPPGDSQEAKRLSAAGTLGMYSNADEHVTRSNPGGPASERLRHVIAHHIAADQRHIGQPACRDFLLRLRGGSTARISGSARREMCPL